MALRRGNSALLGCTVPAAALGEGGLGGMRAPKRVVARPQQRRSRAASLRAAGTGEYCNIGVRAGSVLPSGASARRFGAPQPPPSAIMLSAAGRRFTYAVCVVIGLTEPLASQGVQAPPLAVHAIWGSREYASDLVDVAWLKDGKAYTALEEDAAGHSDLYRVDALTGAKQLLVRGADLVAPGGGAGKPIVIEEYRFSADGSKLLLFTNSARVWRQNTKGTFFVWDLVGRRITPVSTRPGYQQV